MKYTEKCGLNQWFPKCGTLTSSNSSILLEMQNLGPYSRDWGGLGGQQPVFELTLQEILIYTQAWDNFA